MHTSVMWVVVQQQGQHAARSSSIRSLSSARLGNVGFRERSRLDRIRWTVTRRRYEHWDPPAQQADVSSVIEVRWRRATDVTCQLPQPPPTQYDEDGYLPQPRSVITEQVTDFPFREVLPAELRPRLEELIHETGDGGDVKKLGGWPTWQLTHPTVLLCGDCGTAMTLLFAVASDDETGGVVGR